MKSIAAVLCLFAFAGVTHGTANAQTIAPQHPSPNFSGVWVLNKSLSRGLGAPIMDSESMTWTIVQTTGTIAVTDKIAGGPHPGGGSIGTYNLDGRESTDSSGDQASFKVSMTSTWTGSALTLIRKQTPAGQPGTTAKRTLTLSADAKRLTVVLVFESPRGKSEQTMVFDRQSEAPAA